MSASIKARMRGFSGSPFFNHVNKINHFLTFKVACEDRKRRSANISITNYHKIWVCHSNPKWLDVPHRRLPHLIITEYELVKVMPDYASLRHEFRVSTGRTQILNPPLRDFTCILRHTFLLPVEIRNTCLTEARVCHRLKFPTCEGVFLDSSRQSACLSASIEANMRGHSGSLSSNHQRIWIHMFPSSEELFEIIRDRVHVWVLHRSCVTFQLPF